MTEYYVYVDTVEQDGDEWNHLLQMQIRGKEYLISATTLTALGQVGSRLWVTWSALECNTVTTVERAGDNFVAGKVKLCTATDVKVNP